MFYKDARSDTANFIQFMVKLVKFISEKLNAEKNWVKSFMKDIFSCLFKIIHKKNYLNSTILKDNFY